MSHSYPSDITREQFAQILPLLESARRRTKPRTVDLYDVFLGEVRGLALFGDHVGAALLQGLWVRVEGNEQGGLDYAPHVQGGDGAAESTAVLGGSIVGSWAAWRRAVAKAIPVISAYQVGGCQAVYEVSVEYSRARIQFGTPIGRFQRVQDQIINLVNHLDAARWTTYEALWKLDTGRDAASSVSLAKAVASEGYYEACNYAHEVLAGVGSMTEYGLTLHTAASRTLYHFLGDPKQHRRELATSLGL